MSAQMKVQTTLLGDKRVGCFVDLKALDTAATVKEAIDKGYLVGKLELIVSVVSGVIRSMVAGVSRDGNGRKVDGIVSLQPSLRCKLADNCEPVTKDNVEAKLRARVLSEGLVDATDWSFTVEGATGSLNIESITTGEVMGEVVVGEAIDFNGTGLNLTNAATLSWVANDGTQTKTGTVQKSALTCSENRITTAANVLASLTGDTWDGKTVVFNISDSGKTAIKSATLRVA